MRVLHVITSLSRDGGGPARSVQGLVAGLNAAGIDAWLLSLRRGDEPWVDGVLHFVNGEPFENVAARIRPDVVHIHGLWSFLLHRCAMICRRWRIPYVIAPRGMLEPWSLQQKWLKKRIARFVYQDRDLKCAAALHATAESEAEQFSRLGFNNPVIVSPNGVNVPDKSFLSLVPCPMSKNSQTRRRVLFVSRMHPKKGAMELVEAWSCLKLYDSQSTTSPSAFLAHARMKVEGWLCNVTRASFDHALDMLLDAKIAAGEYRFNSVGSREVLADGARRFFHEFSQRIVQLSDGRCVYFTPDERARGRNADDAVSWAEYAVHAATNGGARVSGKNYNERWLNVHKVSCFSLIEPTLRQEKCAVRLHDNACYDSVMFVGETESGHTLHVVARPDVYGNIDANLAEVTFEASSKKRAKKPPRLVPLAEAVGMVVHHQIAAGSYPSNKTSLAFSSGTVKSHVPETPEWECEFVYTTNSDHEREYESKVRARVAELGLEDQFVFTGALNDEEKWQAYGRADLFVLPTYSENFGIVVAEALWAGVPVITTKGTPWKELEERKCGWWIDIGVEPLAAALEKAIALTDEERREMGEHGRRLVEEKYTWDAVVKKMIEGYGRIERSRHIQN